MANTDARRVGSFHMKKLLSQMVIAIDETTKPVISASGNYLVAQLPEGCIIQNAYLYTTVAGAGTVDVGTTEGGTDILASADLTTVGATGTAGSKLYTGTGKQVFVDLSAAVLAATEAYIVIEYLELDVDTGSMTRIK